MFNEITGLVNQTQVMYTRSGSSLALHPVGTPGFDQSIIPTYELYRFRYLALQAQLDPDVRLDLGRLDAAVRNQRQAGR